nr:hypothetical protein [Azospirillum argentinense]
MDVDEVGCVVLHRSGDHGGDAPQNGGLRPLVRRLPMRPAMDARQRDQRPGHRRILRRDDDRAVPGADQGGVDGADHLLRRTVVLRVGADRAKGDATVRMVNASRHLRKTKARRDADAGVTFSSRPVATHHRFVHPMSLWCYSLKLIV